MALVSYLSSLSSWLIKTLYFRHSPWLVASWWLYLWVQAASPWTNQRRSGKISPTPVVTKSKAFPSINPPPCADSTQTTRPYSCIFKFKSLVAAKEPFSDRSNCLLVRTQRKIPSSSGYSLANGPLVHYSMHVSIFNNFLKNNLCEHWDFFYW